MSEALPALSFIGSTRPNDACEYGPPDPDQTSASGLGVTAHTVPSGDATYHAVFRSRPIVPLAFTAPATVSASLSRRPPATFTHSGLLFAPTPCAFAMTKATRSTPTTGNRTGRTSRSPSH